MLRQTQNKKHSLNRRAFGKSAAAAIAAAYGCAYLPAHAFGNLEKPALAGIGSGGKGRSDIKESDDAGCHIAALVDVVDATKLASAGYDKRLSSMIKVRSAYPDARYFTDYREMFDQLGDKIDAVTVSTPDHHHFHASIMAMKAGKHVYCQKPLTHSIWEARTMARVAARTGVKTQMGNQAHASDQMRRCVELIRAGIVGKVKEIHAWTNRPIWAQGFQSPPPPEKVPVAIDWEQWVGPAPAVDYSSKIAPFAWRGWWNYGTGALGDMACHIMDMGFWAMMPGAPRAVQAHQHGASEISPPINSKITWNFDPSRYSASDGFTFNWYDGYVDAHFDRDGWKLVKNGDDYNHPGEDVLEGMDFSRFGSVIIGETGKLFFNRGRPTWKITPAGADNGFAEPDQSIPRAPDQNNHREWVAAINGKIDQCESNFGHAGPFTETILLGVLAQRFPDTQLEWDTDELEVNGRPDLKKYIQRPYRKGWEIDL